MPKDNFHLVPRILAESKYFDISQSEIERYLYETGEFEFECDLEIEDAGEPVVVTVELRIRSRGYPHCTIALLMHATRIDCIDRETKFTDENGETKSGWHRHIWHGPSKQADKQKRCIPDVEGADCLEEFLTRAFQVMNITLNRNDHGLNDELRFN
ncbi:MAG: hypothetical protein WB780_12785 [Candidatus Acidiferrales bacterium]